MSCGLTLLSMRWLPAQEKDRNCHAATVVAGWFELTNAGPQDSLFLRPDRAQTPSGGVSGLTRRRRNQIANSETLNALKISNRRFPDAFETDALRADNVLVRIAQRASPKQRRQGSQPRPCNIMPRRACRHTLARTSLFARRCPTKPRSASFGRGPPPPVGHAADRRVERPEGGTTSAARILRAESSRVYAMFGEKWTGPRLFGPILAGAGILAACRPVVQATWIVRLRDASSKRDFDTSPRRL